MKHLGLWIEDVAKPEGDTGAYKVAHIVVQECSTGRNGEVRLSSGCKNASEVEQWVDLLIRELDMIKRKAREILSA
jgi:hypothetical protein